jgi:hypothetical protein
MRIMQIFVRVIALSLVVACSPLATVSGGAMLNVQPGSRPAIVGAYDFDLLDPVRGSACIKRASSSGTSVVYRVARFRLRARHQATR